LLATVAIVLLATEAGSTYLLEHASPTYARISQQYQRALKIVPAEPGQPTNVLMVGNSLLLDGIEMDRLRAMTSSRMEIYPVFLEATGYYDWLYALGRLFRQGARPDAVVVGVGVNQFLSNGIRQDYAPKLFFDARDTLDLASDLKLDRNATSNLLLAHVSTFWDTRGAIRTQVLSRILPGLSDLLLLVNRRSSSVDREEVEVISAPRLATLQQLCAAHGVKLILLLPPTLSSETAVNEMELAADKAGVEVSVPIDPAALSSGHFQADGMHLNSNGARLFTAALAKDLRLRLSEHSGAPLLSRTAKWPVWASDDDEVGSPSEGSLF
jgi:hypothetical protein